MKRTHLIITGLMVLLLAGLTGQNRSEPAPSLPNAPTPEQQKRMVQTLGQLPLYFIENRGQLDEQVAYYVQGSETTVYFTATGVTIAQTTPAPPPASPLSLRGVFDEKSLETARCTGFLGRPRNDSCPGNQAQRWSVKLEFVGANPDVRPVGEGQTEAIISYFKGQPEEWHAGLPTYSRVVYHDLWSGIDMVYEGSASQLKYTFIVQPGADPSQIQLAYQGATDVTLNDAGQLEVSTPLGGFTDDTPVAYQEINGERVPVEMAYVLDTAVANKPWLSRSSKQVSSLKSYHFTFHIGDYDSTQTLVLDPIILLYAGYIGGSGEDVGYGIAVDGDGDVYVTGNTFSSESSFPVFGGPDITYNGFYDAFIVKVSNNGQTLLFAGYIGGSQYETGNDVVVDETGDIYVVGRTSSDETTFPVLIGPDLTFNGFIDVFVAKIDSSGSALLFAGYVGGSEDEYGVGIALDTENNVYITGWTGSSEATFPVISGPDLTYNGGSFDAFIAKVANDGSSLSYAGYIGGSGVDQSRGIVVDTLGNAFIVGRTASTENSFPVVIGPDLTFNGSTYDVFVAKISGTGTFLEYAGYIGGASNEDGYSIAIDSLGSAYVTGETSSDQTTFPVLIGPDLTANGGSDCFVAKVAPDGTSLLFAGYIGGENVDFCAGIVVDENRNAYVVGETASTEGTFPILDGPDLTFNGGYRDAFVAKVVSNGSSLLYAGYVGGFTADFGKGIAIDTAGNIYITGWTDSTETSFPVSAGPDLTYNGGTYDAFVVKMADTVDNLPPLSSASSPFYANTIPISVTWTASDAASGVDNTNLWVKFGDSGVWTDTGLSQPGTSGNFSYTPANGDGTYYFATVATDNVGNVEPDPTGSGDDSTIYDITAPNSSATSPEVVTAAPITVTWTASDATSQVSQTSLWVKRGNGGMWTDSGLVQSGTVGVFYYMPIGGSNTYFFATVATDNAGNVEATPTESGDDSTTYETITTVFLPVIVNNYPPCFIGPMEEEPNNGRTQANGPLCFGRQYQGLPDDANDYFYFELGSPGSITVDLTNHVGQGLQLLIYDGTNTSPIAQDIDPPYHIELPNNQHGRYYVRIYSTGGYTQSPLYQITVNAGGAALLVP